MLVDQKLESIAKNIIKAKFLEICAIPEHALKELFSYFTLEKKYINNKKIEIISLKFYIKH